MQNCSFCGADGDEETLVFQNEEGSASICGRCVLLFSANVSDEVEER